MNKTKIEWTDSTWNPCWGCLNNCEYCYARRMAKRFWFPMLLKDINYHGYVLKKRIRETETSYWVDHPNYKLEDDLKNFKPTWLESNFQRKFPKKPARIFVDSMSEVWFWKPEWMERVLNKIREYPQHTFQFLTKFPEVYRKYDFPLNCWLGVTVTNNTGIENLTDNIGYGLDIVGNKLFLSIEPILEKINLTNDFGFYFDWIIVGAMSGPGSKNHQPEPGWIVDIYKYCRGGRTPLFMKDSIWPYWNGNPYRFSLITEFPGGENE